VKSGVTDRRKYGLASAAALVVASMVGSGVFTTSGYLLADLGSADRVMLAWLCGGVVALCGALSYGGLARAIPESGGEYTFLREGIHPLAGFLAGWISLLAGFTAPIAIAALALEAYAGPLFGLELPHGLLGGSAIAFAFAMHGLRRAGVLLQNATVLFKLLLIVAFVILGWTSGGPPPPGMAEVSVPPFSLAAFAASLVWVSFSFSGWNAAVYVAGEVRQPERNLRRALLWGAGVVFLCYLALNAVFLRSVPAEQLAGREEVAALAAEALGGAPLHAAISGLVLLCLFSSISSMMMAGPRVYARMADHGFLPGRLRFSGEVPTAAVAFQGLLAGALLFVADLRELLGYAGFTLSLSAAATACVLFPLRRARGAAAFPVPGFPWVTILFVGTTLWSSFFLVTREPLHALWGLLTIVSGLPLYFLARRRASA
jgi:amino acid transporter